jgi:hypothetical protein
MANYQALGDPDPDFGDSILTPSASDTFWTPGVIIAVLATIAIFFLRGEEEHLRGTASRARKKTAEHRIRGEVVRARRRR